MFHGGFFLNSMPSGWMNKLVQELVYNIKLADNCNALTN